jgi:hypothetical protein
MVSDVAVDATRRRLLGMAWAVAIICRVRPATAALADQAPAGAERGVLVRSLLPDLAAAGRIGSLYLSQTPSEKDPALLWSALFAGSSAGDRAACRDILAARITADFRSADVLRLHGWVVARSEARLCALSCCG